MSCWGVSIHVSSEPGSTLYQYLQKRKRCSGRRCLSLRWLKTSASPVQAPSLIPHIVSLSPSPTLAAVAPDFPASWKWPYKKNCGTEERVQQDRWDPGLKTGATNSPPILITLLYKVHSFLSWFCPILYLECFRNSSPAYPKSTHWNFISYLRLVSSWSVPWVLLWDSQPWYTVLKR